MGLKSFQMIEDKFQQFHNFSLLFSLVILTVTRNGIAINFAKMNYGGSTAVVQWHTFRIWEIQFTKREKYAFFFNLWNNANSTAAEAYSGL